jgi:hypothetical protein
MAELVYVLCALTSSFCAGLLVRNYLRTRLRLALLACLCFAGLAINNLLLFVDLVVAPNAELGLLRSLVAIVAVALLVVGMILEER